MSRAHKRNQGNRAADDDEDEMDTTDFFTGIGDDHGLPEHRKLPSSSSGGRIASASASAAASSSAAPIFGRRGAARREAEKADPDANAAGVKIPGTNRMLLPAIGTRVIQSEASLHHADSDEARAGRLAAEQKMIEFLRRRSSNPAHKQNGGKAIGGGAGAGGANKHKAKRQ
jgi:hypothetical protein